MTRLLALAVVLTSAAAAQTPAPQSARLNAAVETFVDGLWELTGVEDHPRSGSELVFARVAFADGDMTMTTVYLDPDDGDLAGRSRRDPFRVADGQLVVRDGLRTRLYDVRPDSADVDAMALRDVRDGTTMRFRRVDAAVLLDPGLYGTWHVAPPASREAITIAFGPDGRAAGVSGGEAFDVDYVVAGAYVIVDNRDTFRYARAGDTLVFERGDEQRVLRRVAR